MKVSDKIQFCNNKNIFINAKKINNIYAKIEIKNNGKIITGNNFYNLFNKKEVYLLWYKIEELYLKYFEKIKEIKR